MICIIVITDHPGGFIVGQFNGGVGILQIQPSSSTEISLHLSETELHSEGFCGHHVQHYQYNLHQSWSLLDYTVGKLQCCVFLGSFLVAGEMTNMPVWPYPGISFAMASVKDDPLSYIVLPSSNLWPFGWNFPSPGFTYSTGLLFEGLVGHLCVVGHSLVVSHQLQFHLGSLDL